MRRRRGRTPTPEEKALWSEVAATLSRRRETTAAPASDIAPPAISAAPAPAEPEIRNDFITMRPAGRPWPQVTTPQPRHQPASGLDRATETRLRKGRRAPDARIDLHGMTANRAHTALIAFILHSHAAGKRCVLVITGKGDQADGSPGVLRREAPYWLSNPAVSEKIVHISHAHPRHGGGGALYVYLKKRR